MTHKKICGAAEKVQKAGTGAAVCTVLTISRGQGASAQDRDTALSYNLRYTPRPRMPASTDYALREVRLRAIVFLEHWGTKNFV